MKGKDTMSCIECPRSQGAVRAAPARF